MGVWYSHPAWGECIADAMPFTAAAESATREREEPCYWARASRVHFTRVDTLLQLGLEATPISPLRAGEGTRTARGKHNNAVLKYAFAQQGSATERCCGC